TVHYCRVMLAAELPADLRIAVPREPFAQIHCNLPRHRDRTAVALGFELFDRHLIVGSDRPGYTFHRDALGTLAVDDVLHCLLGNHLRDRNTAKRRDRYKPQQRTLKLTDITLDLAGDKDRDLVRKVDAVHVRLAL